MYKDDNELISYFTVGQVYGVNSIVKVCNVFPPVWVECVDVGWSINGYKRLSFTGEPRVEYCKISELTKLSCQHHYLPFEA